MNKGSVKKRCKKERKLGDVTLNVLHQILRRVAYFGSVWLVLVKLFNNINESHRVTREKNKSANFGNIFSIETSLKPRNWTDLIGSDSLGIQFERKNVSPLFSPPMINSFSN